MAPSHDVPIATFHIYESDRTIKIDINFDVQDLSKALELNSNKINLKSIEDYLDNHTKFLFNTRNTTIKLSTFRIIKDHIIVKGYFENASTKIETLEINNTCLNEVYNHSNIIQMDINDQSKDYRMHVGRTSISLKYLSLIHI